MADLKVMIDGKEHEISPSDLQLGEGYGLITPDSVPDGYFTQDAVNSMVKENVNKEKQKSKDRLKEDEAFNKQILSKYNIVLGEDGKPKGLKPTEDIDQVRQEVAEQISSDYEQKLKEMENKLSKRNQAVIDKSIMSVASSNYREDWTKAFDGGDPLVVKHFRDRIGVDEDGNPYVKDENGDKRFKGSGPMSVEDYMLDENRFGELLKDKRQRGSGFGEGSQSTQSFTEEQIEKMSDAEYEKHRDSILNGQANVN